MIGDDGCAGVSTTVDDGASASTAFAATPTFDSLRARFRARRSLADVILYYRCNELLKSKCQHYLHANFK
jgi:hypothetical protein